MKAEIDLDEVTLSYLNYLAEKHETTTSDIVTGLLMGFALSCFTEPEKSPKIKRKKPKLNKFGKDKRFAKRYLDAFDYLTIYGHAKYTNNEID